MFWITSEDAQGLLLTALRSSFWQCSVDHMGAGNRIQVGHIHNKTNILPLYYLSELFSDWTFLFFFFFLTWVLGSIGVIKAQEVTAYCRLM